MSSAFQLRPACRIAAALAGVFACLTFPPVGRLCALEGAPPPSGDQNVALNDDEASLSAIELLGKRVFEDTTLSRPAGVSCASCHDLAKAFTGDNGSPIPAVARGSRPDMFGTRNTPSLMYGSFSPPFSFVDKTDEKTGKVEKTPIGGQFLDGRASDLLQQVEGPLLNPREMNNPSKRAVVEKIRDGAYSGLARRVYGASVFKNPEAAFEKLAQAVVAFENTERFHPFASKFDDFLRGQAKLTPLEARGFELFKDPKKGNCLACHVGDENSRDPKDWLFTDFSYDALGAPRNAAIPDNKSPEFFDLGLCQREKLDKLAPKGFDVDSLCGAFKVPTLRNVAITAPYLHNGVFTKLRDVVAFYATRDTHPERWYPNNRDGSVTKFNDLQSEQYSNVNMNEVPYDRKPGQKPRLNDKEIDAIVAFLETLTDRRPEKNEP
jgi:cytochrome c peroxidase